MTDEQARESSSGRLHGGLTVRVSRRSTKGEQPTKGEQRMKGEQRIEQTLSVALIWAATARRIGAGFSVALMLMAGLAAPSMAQSSLDRDLGIVRACGADVWRLCSDVLPDVGFARRRAAICSTALPTVNAT